MKVNGWDLSWPFVILIVSIIAHGAVTYYRVDQLENRIDKRENLELDKRLTVIEEQVKEIRRDIRRSQWEGIRGKQ